MNIHSSNIIYKHRLEILAGQRKTLTAVRNRISWGRLFSIVSAIIAIYFLKDEHPWFAALSVLFCAGIFFRLLAISVDVTGKINNCDRLSQINQQELNTANGEYLELKNGLEYLPPLHPNANDLDIFGRASLFQYINRTTSGAGTKTLAGWLLDPADTPEIIKRQEAVKELSPMYEWRQQLQAHGMAEPVTLATLEKLRQWLGGESTSFSNKTWQVVRYAGPAVIISIVILYINDNITTKWFNLYLGIFFAITSYISRMATPDYKLLNKIAPEIATLSNSIRHIEIQDFHAAWLKSKRAHFISGKTTASAAVKKLNGILSRLDIRLNPVAFIPLNILFFWDLQQMLAFEKWKKAHNASIMEWFEITGHVEAISSLASLPFNNPSWCFPEMLAIEGTYMADDLGHPLIAEKKRVTSSFATAGLGNISIITGSNMAGKSTFLRSVGLSLVMGMTGGPVCASRASFAHMRVISTMRISDNLEESTSTFYAELKKLKQIIEAVNRKEKIFLLMDEILRGTNSLDRHTGSKALIQQLIQHEAAGIIATHDLELANLISDYPGRIHNYHFDVQVNQEELFFDYKLKDGVCKSLNASILMKKIGIEM